MRVIFIKQATDWATLALQLVAPGRDSAQALAALQRANPHLDVQKLGDGAVLLVPDLPGLKAADREDGSISGEAFDGLQAQFKDELAATSADVRSGWAELLAEQREVAAVLKKATALIGSDPDLKAQAQQALEAAKADTASAKAADAALKVLEDQVHGELAGLARLLGGKAVTEAVKGGVKGGAAGATGKAGTTSAKKGPA